MNIYFYLINLSPLFGLLLLIGVVEVIKKIFVKRKGLSE